MILPQAKEAYLKRKVESFGWIKRLSDKRLKQELKKVGISVKGLWRHQRECILIGAYRPHFAFWLDMGTGKTLISLKICEAHDVNRVLVVVPFRVQLESWKAEIRKWDPPFRVDVMTYAAARNRVCVKVQRLRGHKAGTNRLRVDQSKARDFGKLYGATIVDESSLIGNRQSVIFQAIKKISIRHPVRLALSGTPFGRDPALLWPQMKFVDLGASLGSWGMFRECFLRDTGRYRRMEMKRSELPRLHRLMAHRSVRIHIEDCMDMPDKSFNRIHYDMPKAAKDAYAEMQGEMLKVVREGEVTKIEACFVRLRQITSGFIYVSDEDGREVLDLGLKARIEAMAEVVEGTEEPVVIFHEFHATRDALLEFLKKEGITHTQDSAKWQQGGLQALVLPNAAGAMGGNFQRARYMFFLEAPLSPLVRSQAEARIWRGGQSRTCLYYDLVAQGGGLDARILKALLDGKDLMHEVLGGRESLE